MASASMAGHSGSSSSRPKRRTGSSESDMRTREVGEWPASRDQSGPLELAESVTKVSADIIASAAVLTLLPPGSAEASSSPWPEGRSSGERPRQRSSPTTAPSCSRESPRSSSARASLDEPAACSAPGAAAPEAPAAPAAPAALAGVEEQLCLRVWFSLCSWCTEALSAATLASSSSMYAFFRLRLIAADSRLRRIRFSRFCSRGSPLPSPSSSSPSPAPPSPSDTSAPPSPAGHDTSGLRPSSDTSFLATGAGAAAAAAAAAGRSAGNERFTPTPDLPAADFAGPTPAMLRLCVGDENDARDSKEAFTAAVDGPGTARRKALRR